MILAKINRNIMLLRVEVLKKPLTIEVMNKLIELNKQSIDPFYDFKKAQNIFVAALDGKKRGQPQPEDIIGFAILNKPHGHWYFRNCVVDKRHDMLAVFKNI